MYSASDFSLACQSCSLAIHCSSLLSSSLPHCLSWKLYSLALESEEWKLSLRSRSRFRSSLNRSDYLNLV